MDVLEYQAPQPRPPYQPFGMVFWCVMGLVLIAFVIALSMMPHGRPRR